MRIINDSVILVVQILNLPYPTYGDIFHRFDIAVDFEPYTAVGANYSGTGALDQLLELTNTIKLRHQTIRKIYLNAYAEQQKEHLNPNAPDRFTSSRARRAENYGSALTHR